MSGKKVHYWDTNLFLAYLKDESRMNEAEMPGIIEQVQLFEQGQIYIATSTITLTEICLDSIPEEKGEFYNSLFSNMNFLLIDVDRKIAMLAEEIRNFHRNGVDPTYTVPDCIHVATAINKKCDYLFTTDGTGRKRNRPGILQLGNPVIDKYTLDIRRPEASKFFQMQFAAHPI
jgi:hypothetical protein